MAYVATRGGEQAIKRAEQLHRALNGQFDAGFVRAIEHNLPYLVDRVMGEGSLYAPELAALALAQTGGDLYEAVLLMRAYRSTLPRLIYAEPVDEETLLTVRRISAAFKDIPGGQILGPTLDYSHRILRTDILDGGNGTSEPEPDLAEIPAPVNYPAVSSWQRLSGLLDDLPERAPTETSDLPDVTRQPIAFPASREHRLQSLSRADTGGILALGYAGMRGYGLAHPTVNEVKLAYADVRLRHPVTGAIFTAGRVRVSQAEIVSSGADGLDLGFSATLGWNEVKTIAAAMLDVEMNKPTARPFHTDEFVIYHTEPVEASGFCIHFKLPHYVTFNSALDSIRRVRERREEKPGGNRLQQMITSAARGMVKEMAR
jgi:alpha-D-ribose 1-methylphosphonate 5-triphosphate synthase subunit PhnI